MNRIQAHLQGLGRATRVAVLSFAVLFVSAGIAQATAATTIGTNVSTTGTLSVTGLSSLSAASSTLFSANYAQIGGTATSTFNTDGTVGLSALLSGTSAAFSSTLGVTGVTSLTSASTSGAVAVGGNYLAVGGNATTTQAGAISTKSTITVGASGNAVNNIIAGYCVTGSITIPSTQATPTQTNVNCTPYTAAGAPITSLSATASRVFMQATSSLPFYVVLQSASSTATNTINVSLTNFSTTTSPSAAVYAFNFWSFQ